MLPVYKLLCYLLVCSQISSCLADVEILTFTSDLVDHSRSLMRWCEILHFRECASLSVGSFEGCPDVVFVQDSSDCFTQPFNVIDWENETN